MVCSGGDGGDDVQVVGCGRIIGGKILPWKCVSLQGYWARLWRHNGGRTKLKCWEMGLFDM
ncbi:hypothetical protein T12_11163 [Trichinella patagoniensis]|uniref:Uncharacterized protein n=1 Tax=Trichinella patagoniensis TaxID=990121 RepID=A0A0V0ZS14_9BILA|nr:hypothetical protein T12_11163 [Trichinella patagoniensis]